MADDNALSQDEIDALLGSTSADSAPAAPVTATAPQPMTSDNTGTSSASFQEFKADDASDAQGSLNMLDDVTLDVKIELGRTHMDIKRILALGDGSIVELDKLAGDPCDILINEKLVARGEVLVLNENFSVRVTDIVTQEDRINFEKQRRKHL